ncbi:MAG: glycosyltransferase family 1 protein, partial [Ilumatobacter sp.]
HHLPADYVLAVGTLEPRKNLRRLIAAMERIDLPLVVAGADGWGGIAREFADSSDVRFLGHVDPADLPAIYSAAQLLAYPSEDEGFGLPVLEAMSAGTPVVTSRGTATEDVAGGAAVLVDPYDTDSITAGIQTALADRERLIALGHDRATQHTWAATAAATATAYREALG